MTSTPGTVGEALDLAPGVNISCPTSDGDEGLVLSIKDLSEQCPE